MSETNFIRTKKEKDFSMIDNTFLRDSSLSMQAKGLFAYILFLPEDWVIYQSELVKHFSNGRDAIAKVILELEDHGYLEKETIKNDNGRFSGCKITVHEKPIRNSSNGFPVTDCPKSEIPYVPSTDNNQELNKPITNEFPQPEDFKKESKKKSSFSKSDYTECYKLITSCQNTLRAKGIQIDETKYSIPALNRWFKKFFSEYGVEETKKGIKNSLSNSWLINSTHYSLSALFSDKIFPKLINNQSFTSSSVSYQNHAQIDYMKNADDMKTGQEF